MTLESFVLSAEIMLMIFSFLASSDIQNLRLVSWDYHNCASQYLIRTLSIASDSRSLQFWEHVSSDDLFRRGITCIVYHTGPTYPQPPPIKEWKCIRRILNTSTYFLSEVGHCYDVYSMLGAGLPRLPMVEEVMITDQYSPARLEATSAIEWDLNQLRRRLTSCEDDELGVFILLRALSEAKLRPIRFDLHVAKFIPGSTKRSWDQISSSKQSMPMPTYLFQSCVSTAAEIFNTSLRELNISTCGPDPEWNTSCYTKAFEENLMALILTAGPQLETLRLVIEDMPMPSEDPNHILFSGILFRTSHISWPLLSSLELCGVDINGYDLITLFSHRSCLSKLSLQDVYLTPNSLAWTHVLDNLCVVFEAHLEAGAPARKDKGDTTRPKEQMKIDLNHVFEPWDEDLQAGLTVRAENLSEFFEGNEGNPLRVSYESFRCRDDG